MGRLMIVGNELHNGHGNAFGFKFGVGYSNTSEEFGASHFVEDGVVGVIDYSHLVGVRIANSYGCGKFEHDQED